MLAQLTRYLLQFHQVHIPSVGTVKLAQQSATLDVAAKEIHPPVFTMQFSEDGWLSKHQLHYFCSQLHFDEGATRDALQEAGLQLRKTIESNRFLWNGVGSFFYHDQKIRFEPQQHAPLLQPVRAERVLREGVQHSVLVGDQVVLSDANTLPKQAAESSWKWRQLAGWAAVILAVFFIVFYLYQNNFSPAATGLRETVTAKPPAATYR